MCFIVFFFNLIHFTSDFGDIAYQTDVLVREEIMLNRILLLIVGAVLEYVLPYLSACQSPFFAYM